MKAMVLNKLGSILEYPEPLAVTNLSDPRPAPGEILVKVSVCGVCHTELDEIEGRTPPPRLPVIPGHQIVGRVEDVGVDTSRFQTGDRVGVAWIHSACGSCSFCRSDRENLCPEFRATGRDAHGGYAQFMTVPQAFAYPIPKFFQDADAAPLLCAGAIGYRSLRLTGLCDGQNLGLTGFGGSAHLVLKMVRHRFPNTRVFVFARTEQTRAFALELGAAWAGETEAETPVKLDSVIDTTPAWKPVVEALKNLAPGGRLVINAIGKETGDKDYLLKVNYPAHLWMEKEIKSVANVSRRDVSEFLELAAEMELSPHIQEYDLSDANRALFELKTQSVQGAKVLRVS
ncbi:MAG: zinc-dependent alcohol dehydrogenase family protein [Acidobacteriota bacterium]|nr:zinc-dependent alcohol dehydrogenase family protein [Acidobacteriota bacterium]